LLSSPDSGFGGSPTVVEAPVVAKVSGKQVGSKGSAASKGVAGGSSPARGGSSPKLVATKPTRSRARRRTVERQYVAIDLHLNRSVVVRENEAGEKVGVTRIDNDPMALAEAIREAGEAPEVAN
jgi:hypothetical protein